MRAAGKFPIVGLVKEPAGVAARLSPSGRGRTSSNVGKVGTGFNRKSSMEIREGGSSSKSRLAKAPRLKGATLVLRADR